MFANITNKVDHGEMDAHVNIVVAVHNSETKHPKTILIQDFIFPAYGNVHQIRIFSVWGCIVSTSHHNIDGLETRAGLS